MGECIKYVDGNMCERTVIKSLEPRLYALLVGGGGKRLAMF